MNKYKKVIRKLNKDHDVKIIEDMKVIEVDQVEIKLKDFEYTQVNEISLTQTIALGLGKNERYRPGAKRQAYDFSRILLYVQARKHL